jgi:hypothetical protein
MVSAWRTDTKDTLPTDTTNVFCSSVGHTGLDLERRTAGMILTFQAPFIIALLVEINTVSSPTAPAGELFLVVQLAHWFISLRL